jgi:hypothetical protein
LTPGIVRYSVRTLVTELNRACAVRRIPVVMLVSELLIDEAKTMREFVSTLAFRPLGHFEIFAVESARFAQNFDPLADLSLFLNARVHICHPLESSVLPSAIINSLFEPKVMELVAMVVMSPAFEIVDILGCGVRRSDAVFVLPAAGVEDTIYFYLDYAVSAIKFGSPGVQFQVRYIDALGRRFVRMMTFSFLVANDTGACSFHFDTVLGSVAARAADLYRGSLSLEPVKKSLTDAKVALLDGPDARALLGRGDRVASAQFADALANHHRCDSALTLLHLLGRPPAGVVRFLAPIGYALALGTAEVVGPFVLTGQTSVTGGWYIAMPGGRGVLLIASGEDLATWAEALGQPPLSYAFAAVCREAVVEILAYDVSPGHPLLRHIEKCTRRG